jgi:regulatory protein
MEDKNYRLLMDYAMRALSRRAHTNYEMREKLQKRPQYKKKLAEKILARLQELDLINDKAFTRRTIESGAHFRHQGPLKIAQRLYQKGIPTKETRRLWEEMEINEREVALAALEKAKNRFARTAPEKLRQRRAQFLAARGFSPNIIFDLARG